MPTARCSEPGWRTRIKLLHLGTHFERGDLLGQQGNALYNRWSLSREPFRVANDGDAYIKVEFVGWYPSPNAQSRWERARAATCWETHSALLQRLRLLVRGTVQRLALVSPRWKRGLTAGLVANVAAFQLTDESEVRKLYCSLAGRRVVRISNKKVADKKDKEEEKKLKSKEGQQNRPINVTVKKIVRLVNKKMPWPSSTREHAN